jgi:hypothetical protein
MTNCRSCHKRNSVAYFMEAWKWQNDGNHREAGETGDPVH